MPTLTKGLKNSNYNVDPVLQESGVSIGTNFTQVEGRILPTPKLIVGNGVEFFPHYGRWNFNDKKLVDPATVTKWAVVNFYAHCDTGRFISDLIKCGNMKGINVKPPFKVFEENPQFRRAPAIVRVEKMMEHMKPKLRESSLNDFWLVDANGVLCNTKNISDQLNQLHDTNLAKSMSTK